MTTARRIKVDWAGDGFSCLWGPEHGFLYYHPDHHVERLHELYGGKNYYRSRSGLSGAGYLTPGAKDIVIPFGFYRVDARGPGHQRRRIVGTTGRKPIFGYCPIVNGGLPKNVSSYPVVLTDGERIRFSTPRNVKDDIVNWCDLHWDDDTKWSKAINIKYLYDDLGESEKRYLLLANGFFGIDALRFADLRKPQREAREVINQSERFVWGGEKAPRWMDVLSICRPYNPYWNIGSRKYATIDSTYRYLTGKFSVEDWPAEINGWAIEHDGNRNRLFCYRQVRTDILAMAVNLETDEEYEYQFSSWEFCLEIHRARLFDLLREKEEKAAVLQQARESEKEAFRESMAVHPDLVVSVEDSVDGAGNCPYGTKEFLDKYNLERENRFGDLLKHPQFGEMFGNVYFRRAVAVALRRRVEATEEEAVETAEAVVE